MVLLLLALGSTGGAYAAFAPTSDAQAAAGGASQAIDEGRALFLKNCSTCHGLNAEGSSDGPTLVGVGAASVDFQVGTGRMPAALIGAQIKPKRVKFTEDEIAALAAYVASLGPGPAIPSDEDVDYSDANIAEGGEIYRTNCAMCHNFAGSGGALTRGKYAPSLKDDDSEAHVRGDAHRPAVDAGLRRQHDDAPRTSATSSPSSRPLPRSRRPAARPWARSGRCPRAASAGWSASAP